ncbi:probable terpene synthase 2 [Prosopis cineraria]|uniref:probable terpene synthase 2 n=1 Tax=Prosopis cineraria TaxID=364024 RepID=UPI00240FA428|nr:probable terpene synthase 2 [Prosopis cineraria]XP_054811087.1 probable terpene synthase 2 [Prosopis cineraria]
MSVAASHHDNTRRCVNYAPTIWGNEFLQFASKSVEVDDKVEHKVNKEKIKMFISSNHQSRLQMLNFIDLVQRLGVSYHFEHEIEDALAKLHSIYTRNNSLITHRDGDDNLHSLALLFRLLRQHGYPISSSDVFERFKDDKGEFNNENVSKDVRGMLALYEAAQLEVHGENILDEALHFTYTRLKSLTDDTQLSPCLNAQDSHRLSQPLHKRLSRIEARHYMSLVYQQQDPSQNYLMLLNFAKLDFNMLQKLHQKELGNITKWWKESELTRKVPYARDRLVESFFWPLAMSYEPQFSTARMITGKMVAIICLLDDTYDAYGTLEELELFTEAIHRWDVSPIKSLPECMKVVFEAVVEVCNEMETVTAKQGTSNLVMPHVKQAFFNLAKAYLMEARWCYEGYIPRYEEYKDNGVVSSTYPLQITSFLVLGNLATKEVLEWIATDLTIVRASSIIGRLMDDMASHKFEQEREHVASGVECCMKQFGVSEEEAYKILSNDVRNCWKDINEECLNNPHDVPKSVLDIAVNFARVSEVAYENLRDRFTNGESLKHYVDQLLLDPIPIEP